MLPSKMVSSVMILLRHVLTIMTCAVVCLPTDGQSESLRKMQKTSEFLNWCEKNGLTTKDAGGVFSCQDIIGSQVGLTAAMGSVSAGNSGCRKLDAIIKAADEKKALEAIGAHVAGPIVRWLRANPGRLTNDLIDDVAAATWAIYRCK